MPQLTQTQLQQILQSIDPIQLDSFAPSNFDKDTMDFIPASSPKHVPLSVEERAQLDLLTVVPAEMGPIMGPITEIFN